MRLLWGVRRRRPPQKAMAARSSKRNALPRFYHDVNQGKPKEYWDYARLKVEWGNLDDYEVTKKVGRGKYSEVFTGYHLPTDKKVVIKVAGFRGGGGRWGAARTPATGPF